MNFIFSPIQRFLRNPSLVGLVLFIISLALVFYFLGSWLLPVMIAIVVAYLLEGLIHKLERFGIRRMMAVSLVFLAFSIFITYIAIALLPTVIHQAKTLVSNLPSYFVIGQQKLMMLPEYFPNLFKDTDIHPIITAINRELSNFSTNFFSQKLFASLLTMITILIYIILIPILVFFFLKDKNTILNWLGRFLPPNKQIIQEIWQEMDQQIGNYIRGKFIEILIIWVLCFIPFQLFGLEYSLLLSLMVGLSVLIPYIGASVVTVPIVVVAYVQFGVNSDFWWICAIYFAIQILDGNVIVPLIFSEAVNIHPVAIIIAVLVFGGLWGFWGIFFAIPLATLVKAIMEAWRRYAKRDHNLAAE
ncbi:AI-2E family transporter [Suttonella sp. R2A3]|uniref:AI-2E family transporter n=1 Tax=Suttonella sp. R2A3 TaxID=2908648 RepID=UPI001F381A62|nr:AI-2E family transporter [Suttonella sp. R2A3]UJF25093.1 AI-2E family transporter [Suttonella sp. R2A3]